MKRAAARGASLNNGARAFYQSGVLDEARIYDQALSAADVQALTQTNPNPVAYWRLDETSGTTASDSSGNGNTGTLENGATWTTGRINNAVNLDGVNDDVSVPSGSSLNPSSAISVAAWFKASSMGNYQFLINKFNHNSGSTSDDSYTFGIDPGGNLYWQVQTSGGFYLMAPAPPVSLFDGQFHHIAGTYDGALMKVYLDGGLVSSIGATGTIVSSSTAVLLGASLNNGAKAFFQQGMLDEARIYNQALTIGDVQVGCN